LRAVLGTKRAPDQSLFDLAVTPNGDLNSPGPTSSRLLTVDIMFDVTNPGLWMAHCHIAEHMQSGMMFSFNVARDPAVAR
jgi:FtsP/CotA-like multicopper oxidase with cupredoxin domain